jgi:hypothetical protein
MERPRRSATPSALMRRGRYGPRVARASQPWAGIRNPVGITRPSTATRLRIKAQGWGEERGPTLGINRNERPYTEGVAEWNGTRTCYFTNNFSQRCGEALTLVPRGWAKRLTRSSSAVQRNSLPIWVSGARSCSGSCASHRFHKS